jgi:hypothetical protein
LMSWKRVNPQSISSPQKRWCASIIFTGEC